MLVNTPVRLVVLGRNDLVLSGAITAKVAELNKAIENAWKSGIMVDVYGETREDGTPYVVADAARPLKRQR